MPNLVSYWRAKSRLTRPSDRKRAARSPARPWRRSARPCVKTITASSVASWLNNEEQEKVKSFGFAHANLEKFRTLPETYTGRPVCGDPLVQVAVQRPDRAALAISLMKPPVLRINEKQVMPTPKTCREHASKCIQTAESFPSGEQRQKFSGYGGALGESQPT
jgi:hypothetical protein